MLPTFRLRRIWFRNIKHWPWVLIRTALLVAISYVIIFPLLSKLSTAFMTETDMWDATVRWIPRRFTLENIQLVIELMSYPLALFNTCLLTTLVSVLQVASCTLIGYGLARLSFRGSGLITALVVFVLVVPPQVTIIPQYLNFRFFNLYGLLPEPGINLIGSFWPFVLMSVTGMGIKNGIFILIMRQFFKGMSSSLEEAAYVDGADPLRTFLSIMLPNAIPALVTVFLFAFVWQWNDFLYTSLFMSGKTFLTTMLSRIGTGILTPSIVTLRNNTGMLLLIAPLLLVYVLMQRHFIESVERTGLVE
jgi:multiple sugar transport system permease protein